MLKYLITDPNYYTDEPIQFKKKLNTAFEKHSIDLACFRDKISTNSEELAIFFLDICKEYNLEKTFLNGDIELAKKLGFFGVQLPSRKIDQIVFAKEKGLHVIASCHNNDEIEQSIKNGADMITYSPIFQVLEGYEKDNKGNVITFKKDDPKGIEQLQKIVTKYDIPIIALGGIITSDHIEKIKTTNAKGFASIRYFL
jgi:thiamine-phosphate pyrophosphorylase